MNPSLYQINTRVWRHRFGSDTQLLDIPDAYWEQLAQLGIEYVWLMGVWQTGPNVLQYALEPGLKESYTRVLPDWTEDDVIGSPYAIDRYILHKDLGKPEDLKTIKQRINRYGLKLILDFVPNHFHAESSWISERPDVFLEVAPPQQQLDGHTFYRSPKAPDRVLAHGKDPYFAAWQDTAQVNYAAKSAQDFMQEQLLEVATLCDGVRCDMAMLPVPHVFSRTWGHALGAHAHDIKPFWAAAIQSVRNQSPAFIFIAEVYWDMEWKLQQLGFDYTYDKRLRDRLIELNTMGVKAHLQAELAFQRASVRFLENHDEDRILSELDHAQAQAAALITYTTPGMRFFYEGQWEGRRKRLPVQLGRLPLEVDFAPSASSAPASIFQDLAGFTPLNAREPAFYQYLLALIHKPILQQGSWRLIQLPDYPNLVCSEWTLDQDKVCILVNYQQQTLVIPLQLWPDDWEYLTTEDATHAVQFPLSLAPFQWVVMKKRN
ncbi:MAG: alpha-amylase family glycosyl hydrolase [Bacteroidota bacterium]